ncbi:hypothetical protein GYA19_02245, partial [Candidatus Beckwithbacteria bacterium]|nr:hypothetical protein [Candidatus Beckwithbacteria bacterium]
YLGIGIIVLIIGGGFFMAFKNGLLGKTDPKIIPQNIKITNISHDKFTVSWITTKATKGSIIYGKDNKLNLTQLDDSDQLTGQSKEYITHHITISNLQAANTYYFKIKSGEGKLFDDNGSSYSLRTAPILGVQAPSDIINGTIKNADGTPAGNALVYVEIDGVSPLSAQVKPNGEWLINLGNARNKSLTSYAQYDNKNSIINLNIYGNNGKSSKGTAKTANDAPMPLITLGENFDFSASNVVYQNQPSNIDEEIPNAEIDSNQENQEENENNNTTNSLDETVGTESEKEAQLTANQTPEQYPLLDAEEDNYFNDEEDPENYVIQNADLTLTNPKTDYEKLYTAKPEFIGTGTANGILTIQIIKYSSVIDQSSVVIESTGKWTYSPKANLTDGTYSIKVSDSATTITRKFIIDTSKTGGNFPAFVSTPSATAKPRTQIPDTSRGTPESGSTLPTIILLFGGLSLITTGLYSKKIFKYKQD